MRVGGRVRMARESFCAELRGERKVSRSILQEMRKQIQHRASTLLRRRRADLLLSEVDATWMVGACFRVPSSLSWMGGGLSFPSSPKKSNVRLFRSRFSGGWAGSFGWCGNLFARSSRRAESFPLHPSRNTKADSAPCFRVAETQAGSSAALRSRCRADGRCLLSCSLRFVEGRWAGKTHDCGKTSNLLILSSRMMRIASLSHQRRTAS